MKIIRLMILMVLLYTVYAIPHTAFAQEASLTINPPLIEIEAIPPATLSTPITIKNNGNDEVDLQILLLPITQSGSENGEVQFLSDVDAFPGANKKITEHIEIRQAGQKTTSIKLLPKEEKKLDLYVGVDKSEPHSDYYFSIVFLPPKLSNDNKDETSGSNIRGGIGTNVLLAVGPRNNAKGLIDTFSAPSFLQSGPVPFTVRIKNTSNHYITPSGHVIIENMFGQKIGKVTLHKSNILTGTTRAFMSDEAFKEQLQKRARNDTDEHNESAIIPSVLWPETFLIGPYKATLTVSLSDKGPLLTREIRFFAFPWQLLIATFGAILIAIVIKNRVNARREQG